MTRQRGSALLLAMLTVALVASLSTTAMWNLWRATELEAAERGSLEAGWLLAGALDWARDTLRQDARNIGAAGAVDHLGEAWATPLRDAALSGFLGVDRQRSAEERSPAQLSVQIVDLQSRLNFRNLVKDGTGVAQPKALSSAPDLAAFRRLFGLLGLPFAELDRAASGLVAVLNRLKGDENPTESTLLPKNFEQLAWLGLSDTTLAALRPHVTMLPERSALNINTASAEALSASLPGLELAAARSLVAARVGVPFNNLAEAGKRVPAIRNNAIAEKALDVKTDFFEVTARLQLHDAVREERSILRREDSDLSVLDRARMVPGLR